MVLPRGPSKTSNLVQKVMDGLPDFTADNDPIYNARSALITEMTALAENLHQIKETNIKKSFPNCFTHEQKLYQQRCILAHEYGVAFKAEIEWSKVRDTLDNIYPNLKGSLDQAIATLEAEQIGS